MYTRRTFPPTLIATFLAGACAPADQSAVAEYGSPDEAVPAIIPVSSFFDNPEIAGAQISPDGEWLSYLKAYEGKLNVFAKRIGSDEEIQLTDDTERPVTGYFWARPLRPSRSRAPTVRAFSCSSASLSPGPRRACGGFLSSRAGGRA